MNQVENPLKWGISKLTQAGINSPSTDAVRLLEHCLGKRLSSLQNDELKTLHTEVLAQYFEYIGWRCKRKPVAKIIGEKEFWGRNFKVNEYVLDPRPDTETLIEEALKEDYQTILDLGTGSGSILVTLLAEGNLSCGVGTDISMECLKVAQQNLKIHRVDTRAMLMNTSWFAGLIKGKFDLIISNPPYITESEYNQIDPEIGFYEPRIALCPSFDGLLAYRLIAQKINQFLKFEGKLILEIGYQQELIVKNIFNSTKLTFEKTLFDLDGRARGLVYRKPARIRYSEDDNK